LTKEQQPVILMSSDIRFKYIEDIFSALALPTGSGIQFRYETKYVPGDILRDLLKYTNRRRAALLVFKGTVNERPALIPVRWAKVLTVKQVADFVVIGLVLEGYPVFNSQCKDGKIETILNCSEAYLTQMPAGLKDFPVCTSQLGYIGHDQGYDTEHWLAIVKLLSFHSKFDGLHFLRVGAFRSTTGEIDIRSGGVINLYEGTYVDVPIEFYADRFDNEEELTIASDEDIIRLASGGTHHFRSRYDSVSSLLHIKKVEGITRTDLRLSLKNLNPEREFRFAIPVSVNRRPLLYWKGMIIPFFGAILIAIQDFLRVDVDIIIRIAIVIVGALLIAAGNLKR
jgi:hypothetical protein